MRQRHPRSIPRAVALRPRIIPANPSLRTRILEIQAELVDELHRIDAAVQDLVMRRHDVTTELRRCRDGLGHVDTHLKRVPLPGDVDIVAEGTIEIRGADLTQAVTAMVRAAGRPVTLGEIHRMLLAYGRRPAGRASQAISNALRPDVAKGRVVKISRGVYGPGHL